MKIKQEFLKLYKDNMKNLELRKVKWLKKLFQPMSADEEEYCPIGFDDGRFEITLTDSETDKIVGELTINGYSIIENPFLNSLWELEIFDAKNYKWIRDNIDFLKEYFKNEKEILVLNVEEFKEVK